MALGWEICAEVSHAYDTTGLVLDRRQFRPFGMSVTDFTAAEWCQQQFALALTVKLPRVSLAE